MISTIGNLLVEFLGLILLSVVAFVAFFVWLNRRNDADQEEYFAHEFRPEEKFARNIQREKDPEDLIEPEQALRAYAQTTKRKPPPESDLH